MSIRENQIISLYINSDIESVDGDKLSEDYETYFTTMMVPMYASVHDVRKAAGIHIEDISDDIINQLIHGYSITAESLARCELSAEWEIWASYYVTYRTAVVLVNNTDQFILAGEGKISKQLGDFTITKGGGASEEAGITKLLKWLECEIYKFEYAIKNCDEPLSSCLGLTDQNARKADYVPALPRLTMKGRCDPNKPVVGRRWMQMRHGDQSGNHNISHNGRKYKSNKPVGNEASYGEINRFFFFEEEYSYTHLNIPEENI